MKNENRILLLNGGGLDSTSQLIILNQRKECKGKIDSLHINYGQLSQEKEWESVEYFSKKYGGKVYTADLMYEKGVFEDHPLFNDIRAPRKKFVLDGRNLMLAGVAIMFAKKMNYGTLMFAFHHEPDLTFLDAQEEFVKKLQDLCNFLELDLKIFTPFSHMEREKITLEAYKLDRDLFKKSWTCYKAERCGHCSHCKQEYNFIEKTVKLRL